MNLHIKNYQGYSILNKVEASNTFIDRALQPSSGNNCSASSNNLNLDLVGKVPPLNLNMKLQALNNAKANKVLILSPNDDHILNNATSVLIAYLIQSRQYNYEEALHFIRKRVA